MEWLGPLPGVWKVGGSRLALLLRAQVKEMQGDMLRMGERLQSEAQVTLQRSAPCQRSSTRKLREAAFLSSTHPWPVTPYSAV